VGRSFREERRKKKEERRKKKEERREKREIEEFVSESCIDCIEFPRIQYSYYWDGLDLLLSSLLFAGLPEWAGCFICSLRCSGD
jgi:hypothetical protein